MRLLVGHTKAVRAVAYLPDGRLVSGGDDATVRVWDAAGACERVFRAAEPVYAVAAAPDGRTVASAGKSTTPGTVVVALWNPDSDAPDGSLQQPTSGEPSHFNLRPSVWSIAFTADGLFLLAGCRTFNGGNARSGAGAYWWRRDGSAAGAYAETANAVAAAPGEAVAVTFPGAVGVSSAPDIPPWPRVGFGTKAKEGVAVAFLPSTGTGRVAVLAGDALVLVDLTASEARQVRSGQRTLTALAAHPGGRTVLVGGSPGGVERYDAATGGRVAAFDFGIGKVHGLAFAPDGHTFAVAGQSGLVVCDAD